MSLPSEGKDEPPDPGLASPDPRAADHAVWAGSPMGGPAPPLMTLLRVRGSRPPCPGGSAAEQAVRGCGRQGAGRGPRRQLLPVLWVGDSQAQGGRALWSPGPPSCSGRTP